MDTQVPQRQIYTFGTLPAGVVLLYREELGDPYTCQAPGCIHPPFSSKQGAIDHGKKHRAAWGLCRDEGVHLHSGRRPWSKDPSYAGWRREQRTQQTRMRREAAREGQRRAATAAPDHQVRRNMESAFIGSNRRDAVPAPLLKCVAQGRPRGGTRCAPYAVGVDLSEPSKPGVRFRVVSVAEPCPSRKLLEILGEAEGEQLEGACQAALSWIRVHQSALKACFAGKVADWSMRDLSFKLEMLEVGMGSYPKSGPSVSPWNLAKASWPDPSTHAAGGPWCLHSLCGADWSGRGVQLLASLHGHRGGEVRHDDRACDLGWSDPRGERTGGQAGVRACLQASQGRSVLANASSKYCAARGSTD